MATKTEDKIIATQLSVGMAERPTLAAGLSQPSANHPTPESGPSAHSQEASDNALAPMDKDNIEEDDLLERIWSTTEPRLST
jgi:hypothetical protein